MGHPLSVNFSNETNHKLVNFNCPQYLIKNFDNLVRHKRVSRTSMIIRLMESYIRDEVVKLKNDNYLNKLLSDLSERNRSDIKRSLKKEIEDEYEPPMIPSSDDNFIPNGWSEWEDRLKDLG